MKHGPIHTQMGIFAALEAAYKQGHEDGGNARFSETAQRGWERYSKKIKEEVRSAKK